MDKQQVVYIHGGDAFTDYDKFLEYLKNIPIRNLPGAEGGQFWSRSLQEDLGDDYEVFTPSMPNKLNAKYEEWKIWFERHFEHLDNDPILIGWSLGGYFLAKYLVENETPFSIKALFLLAPLYENDTSSKDGDDGGDFNFDTKKVGELAKRTKNIELLCSKDDFVVDYKHSLKFKEALPDSELTVFEDKNHFLIEEFPELLEKIRSI